MSGTRTRRVLGVVVLTAGLLLVVDRFGSVAALVAALRVWWPVGLAAFAAINLATFLRGPSSSAAVRWPVSALVVLLLLAGVILLGTTGVMRFDVSGYLLPLAVVGTGLLIILWEGRFWREHQSAVSVTAILRRSVRDIVAKGIYHVRVVVIFGDVHLDLSRAKLLDDTEVHATVVCGRFHLRYPPDWSVNKSKPVGPRLEIHERKPARPGSGKTLSVRTMGGYGDVELDVVDD